MGAEKREHDCDTTVTAKRTIVSAGDKADDVNVLSCRPLISPDILLEDIPASDTVYELVRQTRADITKILSGEDDRLICIVGPCSIHDTEAALEYGKLLLAAKEKYKDTLLIVMRVYFEKPRTTVGWKGLINDPFMDESFRVNQGLKTARKLLVDLNEMGLPAACEFLDTISPQFISDLVSWGAIGARTTESQCHRELASGISCPVGFKNGTGGCIQIAIDAIKSASHPHRFLGVTKHGLAAIVETGGNKATHVILRGGSDGPNYEASKINNAVELCEKAGVSTKMIVDCSHGNSNKNHLNQPKVCEDLAKQISGGDKNICGIMVESNLVEGNQKVGPEGVKGLVRGKSITDACVSWEQTTPMLECMSESVKALRAL